MSWLHPLTEAMKTERQWGISNWKLNIVSPKPVTAWSLARLTQPISLSKSFRSREKSRGASFSWRMFGYGFHIGVFTSISVVRGCTTSHHAILGCGILAGVPVQALGSGVRREDRGLGKPPLTSLWQVNTSGTASSLPDNTCNVRTWNTSSSTMQIHTKVALFRTAHIPAN